MTSETTVGRLLPWYGSKGRMAELIATEIGPHQTYWEPFCGSLAVLYAKPRCRLETINDLNGDLINLALCVRDDDASRILADRVERTLVHEDFHRQAQAIYREREPPPFPAFDLERAYHFLIVSWFGRHGIIGRKSRSTPFSLSRSAAGGNSGSSWRAVGRSLPLWHERLRHVIITRRDALELLAGVPDEKGTVIYLDPPYHPASRTAGADYAFELDLDQHAQLARLASAFRRARVIVSYYDCPSIRALYPQDHWRIRSFRFRASLSESHGSGGKRECAPEILLINGPALEPTLFDPR